MTLLNLIKDSYKIISIIGMAKNSGKTVTLNHLISEAAEGGVCIGITSIGRDGEGLDLVTQTEKPRIFVEENTIVATATSLVSLGDANIEIIMVTDFRTPLGEIVIGRVKSPGYIQIAGPQSLKEIKESADIMLNLGAKFVIIDGALDRRSSASPSISEATILSTGAILSRDMNRVIEETSHAVNILGILPIRNNAAREIVEDLINRGKIAIIDDKLNVEVIDVETALGTGQIIGDHLENNSKYLVIPGSLVKSTIEDIISSTRKYRYVDIVVNDSTKIFIGPKDFARYRRIGFRIKVLRSINLIGVTINPYTLQGYYFEPHIFLEKMKSYIDTVPVMDLILGGD